MRFYLGVAPPLNHYDYGFLRQAICRMALIGASRDDFCEPSRFAALYLSLPATPWVRVLDADHLFTKTLDALAQASRDVIAWANTPA